jgi:hypothetical protein
MSVAFSAGDGKGMPAVAQASAKPRSMCNGRRVIGGRSAG